MTECDEALALLRRVALEAQTGEYWAVDRLGVAARALLKHYGRDVADAGDESVAAWLAGLDHDLDALRSKGYGYEQWLRESDRLIEARTWEDAAQGT